MKYLCKIFLSCYFNDLDDFCSCHWGRKATICYSLEEFETIFLTYVLNDKLNHASHIRFSPHYRFNVPVQISKLNESISSLIDWLIDWLIDKERERENDFNRAKGFVRESGFYKKRQLKCWNDKICQWKIQGIRKIEKFQW